MNYLAHLRPVVFNRGFAKPNGFRERQSGVPPVASKNIKLTAEIVEKHCNG